eukprot:g5397.t1
MAGFGRCFKVVTAGIVVAVAVTMVEMEIFYSVGGVGDGGNTHTRLQWSDGIMVNLAAHLPNEGRLKRKNGEILPALSNDVGTRSVHNGSHQRERQLWLKARAGCIRNGDSSGCMGTFDGSTTEAAAVDASAEAAAIESTAGSTSKTAAEPQSLHKGFTDDRRSGGNAKSGVGDDGGGGGGGGGGDDASSRIRAGTGGSRSIQVNGDVREFPLRSGSGDNLKAGPSLKGGRGSGFGFANTPLPAGAGGKLKQHSNPGIERKHQGVEIQVEVEASAGKRGVSRLLGAAASVGSPEQATVNGAERRTVAVELDGAGAGAEAVELPLEERLGRLETGIVLWGDTYVPPIAPNDKQRLIERWTKPASADGRSKNGTAKATSAECPPSDCTSSQAGAPRILFVVTSFDRGRRLGKKVVNVDKLDYVLMIMDEIRGTCEAGFLPHAHLISAWNAEPEVGLFHDRLFCRRIGGPVPLTLEEHPPSVKEVLAIKHRVYMKPRVKEFDLFIQLEDDMILTVNHILLYLQESDKLSNRIEGSKPKYDFMPGFFRVEPEPGVAGVGGEWFEWEVILSRFRGLHVVGAGTYLGLERSRVLPYAGNNQGFWMATQEQLKYLQRQCKYLRYTDKSSLAFVEKFSGSLEMFSPACHTTKVFPATHFEDFMVHHRTNNKNGWRGESTPAVSVTMLRLWAAQVVRDDEMLMEVGNTGRRRLRG